MESNFNLPTIEGNTDLGASSPAKPALQTPDPLSITNGTIPDSLKYMNSFYALNKIQITRCNNGN